MSVSRSMTATHDHSLFLEIFAGNSSSVVAPKGNLFAGLVKRGGARQLAYLLIMDRVGRNVVSDEGRDSHI